MDRFENMRTFIRVVEVGSISGAADQMEIAKSAVSRRLKELEQHLGVQLLHRTTRSMSLTETGTAFYQQAVRIVDDTLEAESLVSQANCSLAGKLKVALPSIFGAMHIGPAINEFLKIHPNIEFDLDFNDRQVDVIQEGFDLVIRIADLANSSLIARRLTTIKHVVTASPSYLERKGFPQKVEDLVDHQCLAYSLWDDYKMWLFTDSNNQTRHLSINPFLKSSSGGYLLDASIEGHGISYLPTFLAYKGIEQKTLIPLLQDYKHWEVGAYAIYPQTRHLSQRVRVFINFLVKRFEGTPHWDRCLQRPLK